MEKEGYRPSTIRGAVKNLKALSRHCNILNPESLKAYLSRETYGENNKDKILGDMARLYKSLKTVEKTKPPVELGFDYVTGVEGWKLFRKRK